MNAKDPRTAADVMTRDVITVRENQDIRETLQLFQEKHISGAPVLDRDGSLVGVVSVADIARAEAQRRERPMVETEYYRTAVPDEFPSGFQVGRADEIPIGEVMTPVVIDAPESMPVARIAAMMIELHIHRVIITDRGKLLGIVTSLDLLRLLRHAA